MATPPTPSPGPNPLLLPPPSPLPPPFIPTPSIPNLRDAAGSTAHGHPLPTGGYVRPSTLLRSADPSHADASALAALRARNVTRIFDLRSKPEIDRAGGAREELGRVWCPVFAEEDYGPERVAGRYEMYAREGGCEGFVAAYGDIAAHGGAAFGAVLRHFAAMEPGRPEGVLVHCTAGKDRTGVLVAVLLSLLGVEDEVVADDYALTDVGFAHVKAVLVERLMRGHDFRGGREGAERMLSSRKENMLATLVMLRERYGSVEDYVRTVCGLTTEEIERIRQILTVQEVRTQDESPQGAVL